MCNRCDREQSCWCTETLVSAASVKKLPQKVSVVLFYPSNRNVAMDCCYLHLQIYRCVADYFTYSVYYRDTGLLFTTSIWASLRGFQMTGLTFSSHLAIIDHCCYNEWKQKKRGKINLQTINASFMCWSFDDSWLGGHFSSLCVHYSALWHPHVTLIPVCACFCMPHCLLSFPSPFLAATRRLPVGDER